MEALTEAVKDIIKYKAIAYVNTGDLVYDNLLRVMNGVILSLLFTRATWEILYEYLCKFLAYTGLLYYMQKIWTKITGADEFYNEATRKTSKEINFMEQSLFSIILSDDIKNRYSKYHIMAYLVDKLPHAQGTFIEHNKTGFEFKHLEMLCSRTILEPRLIYKNGKKLIYRDTCGKSMCLHYTDKKILDKFITFVYNKYDKLIDMDGEINKKCGIYEFDYKDSYYYYVAPLFEDRTFDKIITRHKSKIINALDKLANSEGNGYESHNLGMMLHGKRGSGKTMLIKAIANRLKRDIAMINMKHIKTAQQFSNLFRQSELDKYVYVLEELDCVEGVFNRDKSNEVQEKMQELKQKELNLLKIKNDAINASLKSAESKVDTAFIDKALESVKKEMDELENALTIYSVLTILDGPVEMRNRVIIATTNNIKAIDPAILRSGRFGLSIEFTEYSAEETRELLLSIYKMHPEVHHIIREAEFPEGVWTPSDIIGFYNSYDNIHAVIDVICNQFEQI